MQMGAFRKAVVKAVPVKPAKAGLRQVAKNTARMHTLHATVALKTDVGRLLQALNGYVLGFQYTPDMKASARPIMGDIGYDLTLLSRVLKVKMPTSTKKAKLAGTRTSALLQLDALTTDLLAVVEKGTFAGPVMTKVKKMVVLPNKAGAKEEREVETVDVAAEAIAENERQTKMRSLTAGVIDLYWKLSYDLFQQTPSVLFDDKLARMAEFVPVVEEPESAPAMAAVQ